MGNGSSMDSAKVVYFDFSGRKEKVVFSSRCSIRDITDLLTQAAGVHRLSEVTLKNKKGLTVELLPSMPANTAETAYDVYTKEPRQIIEQDDVRQKFSLSDDKVDSKSVKNDASLCSSSVCIELWVVPLFVTLSMTVCFYLMLQSLATAQVLIPPSLKSLTSSTASPQTHNERRQPVCPYCQRVFRNSSSDLRRHIWMHEGIKPFECATCSYTCRTRSNLSAHMLRHSADKPFLCNSCGKPYKSRTALRWHERSHVNGRIFKCDKCSYEALQLSHLRRHLETHNVQKRFACSQCDYSANSASYLKIHQTRRHPEPSTIRSLPTSFAPQQWRSSGNDDSNSNGIGSSGLQCHVCQYQFGNASDLRRHARLRHGIQDSLLINPQSTATLPAHSATSHCHERLSSAT